MVRSTIVNAPCREMCILPDELERAKQKFIETNNNQRKENMNKIEEILANENIHPDLRTQLENRLKEIQSNRRGAPNIESCRLHSPELAVVQSCWSDYSSGGGVARDSILEIFYKSKTAHASWRYSDKWSHRKDRWDLCIVEIGKIETEETEKGICVWVECIAPEGYRPRTERFFLEK